MELNEGRVYFSLHGNGFDPNEVSRFLGIEATSIMIEGSRIKDIAPKQSAWMYSTDKVISETLDIYKLSDQLLETLIPIKAKIIDAIKKYDLDPNLQVVLWISQHEEHSTPAIGFRAETIKFLAEVGSSIDIDTYLHES